jgi:hypothetical protein
MPPCPKLLCTWAGAALTWQRKLLRMGRGRAAKLLSHRPGPGCHGTANYFAWAGAALPNYRPGPPNLSELLRENPPAGAATAARRGTQIESAKLLSRTAGSPRYKLFGVARRRPRPGHTEAPRWCAHDGPRRPNWSEQIAFDNQLVPPVRSFWSGAPPGRGQLRASSSANWSWERGLVHSNQEHIPLFDRQDHPFAPTCLWQSAGRSGGQGCRQGGTGGAGARRP